MSYEDFVPLLDAEEVVIADLGYSWCEEQNRLLAPNSLLLPFSVAAAKEICLRRETI
jgi:hypothetical protein